MDVMIQLLKEGFDRLKISVDIINVYPRDMCHQGEPVDGHSGAIGAEPEIPAPNNNGAMPAAPLRLSHVGPNGQAEALHSMAPASPSHAAMTHGFDATTVDQSSFHKLDMII